MSENSLPSWEELCRRIGAINEVEWFEATYSAMKEKAEAFDAIVKMSDAGEVAVGSHPGRAPHLRWVVTYVQVGFRKGSVAGTLMEAITKAKE